MLITIIIPCYNERRTIEKIVNKIKLQKKIKKQIIVVDDFSDDGTRDIIKKKISKKVDKVIFHNKNQGKGAGIHSALKYAKGKIVIIQDADLEYFPSDFPKLIRPINSKKYLAVYGSRVLGRKHLFENKGFTNNVRVLANFVLTKFSNIINNQNLTDAHTCYKVIKTSVIKKLKLKEKDFAFCPEITTKLSNSNITIKEVSIKYKGRNFQEGKKINFYDGIRAFLTIIKYKFF